MSSVNREPLGGGGGRTPREGATGRASLQPWMISAPSLRIRWISGTRPQKYTYPRPALSYGTEYHTPVMVREVLEYLRPERGGVFLDGTLGGGGHSEAILSSSDDTMVIGLSLIHI